MEDNKLSTDKISLGQYYKNVYLCEALGCTNYYGSDEEELSTHICPECIIKNK